MTYIEHANGDFTSRSIGCWFSKLNYRQRYWITGYHVSLKWIKIKLIEKYITGPCCFATASAFGLEAHYYWWNMWCPPHVFKNGILYTLLDPILQSN